MANGGGPANHAPTRPRRARHADHRRHRGRDFTKALELAIGRRQLGIRAWAALGICRRWQSLGCPDISRGSLPRTLATGAGIGAITAVRVCQTTCASPGGDVDVVINLLRLQKGKRMQKRGPLLPSEGEYLTGSTGLTRETPGGWPQNRTRWSCTPADSSRRWKFESEKKWPTGRPNRSSFSKSGLPTHPPFAHVPIGPWPDRPECPSRQHNQEALLASCEHIRPGIPACD